MKLNHDIFIYTWHAKNINKQTETVKHDCFYLQMHNATDISLKNNKKKKAFAGLLPELF